MLSSRLIFRQKLKLGNFSQVSGKGMKVAFSNRLFATEPAKDQTSKQDGAPKAQNPSNPSNPPPTSVSSSAGGSNSNNSTGNTAFSKDKEREIKALIRSEKPSFMSFWYVVGIVGFATACMYYLNESDRHQRHLQVTEKLISSADPSRKLQGLKEIENCLYLEKRMLSGDTYIPQSPKLLVEAGFVEALVDCVLSSSDSTIQELSLVWLLRLSSEPSARDIVIKTGISPIIERISSFSVGSKVWLVGTALISSLCTYDDFASSVDKKQLLESVRFMYQGHSPLGALMAAKISSTLLQKGLPRDEVSFVPDFELSLFNTPSHQNALKAAINSVVPSSSKVLFPSLGTEGLLHMNWALLFGVVGSVYGRVRWTLYSFFKGLRGPALSKFVSKQNKVGRYVFTLLIMDLVSQVIMAWPEKGHQLPFIDSPLRLPEVPEILQPITTSIPIIESGLFISTALYGIRRQKYLILPLVLAAFTKGYVGGSPVPSIENVIQYANKGTDFFKLSTSHLDHSSQQDQQPNLQQVTHKEDKQD